MTRTGDAWRFRQCPNCDHIAAGGEYAWVSGGSWGDNPRRKCPNCGYIAEGSRFPITRARGGATVPCASCGAMPTHTFHDGSAAYSCGPHPPIYPDA